MPSPLFSGLPRRSLAGVLSRSRRKTLVAGEILFLQGERASSFALVSSGLLDLSLSDRHGKEIVFDSVGPGQSVGEIALLDRTSHVATCTAQQSSEVLLFSLHELLELMKHVRFRDNLHIMNRGRLRHLIQKLYYFSLCNLESRLAHYMATVENAERRLHEEPYLYLGETQERIAVKVNATRTRVNITLQEWKRKGLISVSGRRIIIRNVRVFEEMIESSRILARHEP